MIHARLSPSGADRWMVCTASVRTIEAMLERGELKESDLEDEMREQITEEEILDQQLNAYSDVVLDPTRESTTFSAEGTVLHSVRSNCLVFGEEPHEYVGRKMSDDGFDFVIDDDMADRLVPGIDWIREKTPNPIVEERVSLNDWLPGQHGFCDTYWLVRRTLGVSDFKNGVGEPVPVIGTRQLRLYALGGWSELGKPPVDNVLLNIDQPRAGGMKFWEFPFAELLEFGDEVKRVYDRIDRGDVEFAPNSKSCRWCPVRKTKRGCAAYNRWHIMMLGIAVLDIANGDPTFVEPAQMPRAHRYYLVKHAAQIRAWLAKLHEESLAAAIDGDPDPGSKAIEPSGGRRFFTDDLMSETIVEYALKDSAFKPKQLIGFTEIDKLMKPGRKKKGHPVEYGQLLRLVDVTEGKPKLVPADHPAPAYQRAVEDDFDDQPDETIEDDFEDQ